MANLTQILPATRIIPRLSVLSATADQLTALAARVFAGEHRGDRDEEPFAVIMAPVRAQAAAEHYVSEKAFQTSLPEFRRMISGKNKASLRHAVEQLKGHLATGAVPPFAQMRSAYCYGDPNFNGLETDDDATHELQLRNETLWDFRYGPEALGRTLQLWLDLMTRLEADAGKRSPRSRLRSTLSLGLLTIGQASLRRKLRTRVELVKLMRARR